MSLKCAKARGDDFSYSASFSVHFCRPILKSFFVPFYSLVRTSRYFLEITRGNRILGASGNTDLSPYEISLSSFVLSFYVASDYIFETKNPLSPVPSIFRVIEILA